MVPPLAARLSELVKEREALAAEAASLRARSADAAARCNAAGAKPAAAAKGKPAAAPAATAAGAAGADSGTPADDAALHLLKQLGIEHRVFHHPPAGTIASWRPHCEAHAPEARMCKNLFLKDKKKGTLVLCTALAETNTDMKFLAARLKAKNPRLAASEILMDTLGLKEGAVTPLACAADAEHKVRFVLDKAMLDAGKSRDILVHPLSGNHMTVALRTEGLLRFFEATGTEPLVLEFPPPTDA